MKTINENKKTTSKNGITLIALVITIIVLIILAGVTITSTISDNGIVRQSKQAKRLTEQTKILEDLRVEVFEKESSTSKSNIDHIKELKSKGYIIDETEDGKYIIDSSLFLDDEALTGYGNVDSGDFYYLYEGNLYYENTEHQITDVGYVYDKYIEMSKEDDSEITGELKWLYTNNDDGTITLTGLDLSNVKYTTQKTSRGLYGYHGAIKDLYSVDLELDTDTLVVPSTVDGLQVSEARITFFPLDKDDIEIYDEESPIGIDKVADIKGIRKLVFSDSISKISSR